MASLSDIREGNRASQAKRTKAREEARANKDLAKDVRSTLAATKPKPKPSTGKGGPVMDRVAGALGRPAPPVGGGSAVAAPAPAAPVTPSAARGIPPGAPVAPQQAVAPSRASQGTAGVTGTITPRPALPTPATAKGYQEGLKIGAAKVASKALKTSTPPKARPAKAAEAPKKKGGLAGLLEGNKGNNQKLALERMKKASRKG